jgi:hypothetical protein
VASVLNDLFELVLCINLDSRPDRWAKAQKRFKQVGIRVDRFPACPGPPQEVDDGESYRWGHRRPRIGAAMSHIGAVREARRRNLRSIFIFEDDAIFAPEFESKLKKWIRELPADWDMLYLGGWHPAVTSTCEQEEAHPSSTEHVSGHVYRLRRDFCLHAYGVRDTLFHEILAIDITSGEPIDCLYIDRFQALRKCYGLMTADEAEPGTWGLVQQDHSLGSDIRDLENLSWIKWTL